MLLLFNCYVRSRLEYCSEVWEPSTKGQIAEVEQIQRRFTRKIDGFKDTDYWERLKQLNILSLQRRRERKTFIHTWKIKNGVVRNDVNLSFEMNQRTSKMRATLKKMPTIKGTALTTYESSFAVRSGKLWNRLPSELTNEMILSSFIRKLDQWLTQFPDKPPIHGYSNISRNSILDYPGRGKYLFMSL